MKIIKIFILVVLALVLIFVGMGVFRFCSFIKNDAYMFADISECEKLNSIEGAVVEAIDSYGDSYLENLKYKEFYGGSYTSETVSFEIYAYDFGDAAYAQLYYVNATGKKCSDTAFHMVSTLSDEEIIVLNEERAYRIKTTGDYSKIAEVLSQVFTIKLDF